jgi:hypothetical protein
MRVESNCSFDLFLFEIALDMRTSNTIAHLVLSITQLSNVAILGLTSSFSYYSKVYSERTASKQPFFTPLEFSCSEGDSQQIQEFVENAGNEDSFKFVFEDKDENEEKEILYKLTNEKNLLRKGFLNLHSTFDEFEEDFFSVKALTFSTPIPEDERYPEGFNREDVVNVEDTRKVTIPYVDIY